MNSSFHLLQFLRFQSLTPRNLMGKDIEYASLFSRTTKRFNSTIPLSTPGLIPKVAEGPEYMTLMYGPRNHGERVSCVHGSFDPGRLVAGLRLAAG